MRDNEVYGGYAPTAPVVKRGGDYVEGYSEGSATVLAYALVGASGFIIGLLATWIF